MNNYHVVFDIDGTLLDTEKAVLQSLHQTILQMAHKDIPIKELMFALGILSEDALRKLQIEAIEAAMKCWDDASKMYWNTIKIFDGIEDTLYELKEKGFSLGIITSKTTKEYKNEFIPFGLEDYFSVVICADDTKLHKPYSEPMEAYIEKSKALKENVIYVGDSFYDMECAKSAGVKFALALWGCKSPDTIKADYLLVKPQDVIREIEQVIFD